MRTFSTVFLVIALVVQTILLLICLALAIDFDATVLKIAIVLASILAFLAIIFVSELGGKIADIDEKLKNLQQAQPAEKE